MYFMWPTICIKFEFCCHVCHYVPKLCFVLIGYCKVKLHVLVLIMKAGVGVEVQLY